MAYSSATEVAKQLNVPRSSINYHIKKEDGWEFERNLCRAELLSKVSNAKSSDFATINSDLVTILKRSISTLAKREEPPTVNEAKSAAAILDVLDKITRLDDNTPTDIIQEQKIVTVGELQKKIKLDPFNTVEETEYKEITDEETT